MKKLFISIIILAALCYAYPSNMQRTYEKKFNMDLVGLWCETNTNDWYEFSKKEFRFSAGEGQKTHVKGIWYAPKDTNFVGIAFSDGSNLKGFYHLEGDTLEMELWYGNEGGSVTLIKCKKKPYRLEDTI